MFQKLEHPVVSGPAQQSLLLKPSGRYPSVHAVRSIGTCHHCFEYGHLHRSCPLLTTDGSASRVSPAARTYPLLGSVSAPLYDVVMKVCDVYCEDDSGIDAMMAIEHVPEDDVDHEGSGNYESCSDKHPPVKGRLKACVDFWTPELLASPFVIDTIQNGYPLPLASILPMYKGDNHG